MATDVDVLVVGAGPMGATTALALATAGVSVRMITRHRWLSNSPRAHITNQRSLEAMRDLGVEDRLIQVASPWELMGETPIVESLKGVELARIPSWGTGPRHGDYTAASPCPVLDISQPLLERVIVETAAERGALVSFSTEYLDHAQDESGVTVTLRDRISGRDETVRARYLVAADGARSAVVERAGIPITGVMGRAATVYARFSADLSSMVAHRPSTLYWILSQQAAFGEIGMGLLRAVRPWDSWIAGWGYDPLGGEPDLDEKTVLARIRSLVGDPNLDLELLGVSTWEVNQAYAENYTAGRVFAGGDAVHRHPPSGGLGSNTSIQDGYNLAWKLAFVCRGDASPALLDSYSAERAPIGEQIVHRANKSRTEFATLKTLGRADVSGRSPFELISSPDAEGVAARRSLDEAVRLKAYEFSAHGVELNQRYRSSAVIDDGRPAESWARDPELYASPTSRPGAKLPHTWLVDDAGRRVSTLDLVAGGQFTVLTGVSGAAWHSAAEALALPWLRAVVVGGPDARDLYRTWDEVSEIQEDGAILVRPDGYVAWRVETLNGRDPQSELSSALARILGKEPS